MTTTPTETPPNEPSGTTLLTETKKAEPAKVEPKPGAPEKYDDYKVPDGYTLDAAVKTEADALFKTMGLSQDQAQSLVDFYVGKTQEANKQPYEAYETMKAGWRTETENHPDLRGKIGPGQEINVTISRALDSLGDPQLTADFKQLMDLTGAGNHQAFIRVIHKFAQRYAEGTHVKGNGPAPAGQSAPGARTNPTAAQALYPTLPTTG